MNSRTRRAFTLFQLLLVLAILVILFALLLPLIARARAEAIRNQSRNNLKQISLAVLNYEAAYQVFPPGNDANNFSAYAKLLPFIEQGNLYSTIDFKKAIDDKANADARKAVVKVFLNPLDKLPAVSTDYGANNYLLCAGPKPTLADNNGLFFQDSKIKILDITDGTSNTILAGETLKGDSAVKATTVKRQHVLLKKQDLKDIKADAGVKDWEQDKNIVADRGASWMDGRFLQTTFTATRTLNDEKPDVNCAGFGGLSGLRSNEDTANIAFADGSVHSINSKVKLDVWQALAGYNDGIVVPADF